MDEINTKLVQTRIPPSTYQAAALKAALAGGSFATWLRRLIADAVGRDGLGGKKR